MTWRAPCGHVGTPIIATYVRCDAGCDGKPTRCGRCGSEKIEPFKTWSIPQGALHCIACGYVFWPRCLAR